MQKTHFSAVTEGELLQAREAGRKQWVVVGTEAHVSVQQTVLDLLAMGRQVFVIEDAVGSRHSRDKELALQRMQRNGAEIVSREMVVFEWLEQANTPLFRDVLKRCPPRQTLESRGYSTRVTGFRVPLRGPGMTCCTLSCSCRAIKRGTGTRSSPLSSVSVMTKVQRRLLGGFGRGGLHARPDSDTNRHNVF